MVKEFVEQYLREFVSYKTNRWCYEDGILLTACVALYESTNDKKYKDFVIDYLNKFVREDGCPMGYNLLDYNIDDVQAATVLPWAYKETKEEKFNKAIELFYKQLLGHPRCKCGNFFHKKRYPYQVWMDGLYMGQVFYCKYSVDRKLDKNIDDIVSQFKNVRKYLFDEERKLYVHAYDENKVMQWADKVTGKAPNVWSRACGWMMMALVNIYEIASPVYPDKVSFIPSMFKEMIDGLKPYVDKEHFMIHQVVDHIGEKGNYLETSGSSMMAFSLLKAYRLGMVDKSYQELGLKMYEGITKTYLKETDGHYALGGICQVAGLDNERRNGSAEYYYSEKICENEVKGVAPYMMLVSEVLRKDN
jgi:unsaturated rhamnogalacturonyl hydrolase